MPIAWQALEALRKLRTEKMAEVKEFKLRLDHLRTHKDTAARLRKAAEGGERQEAELAEAISSIDAQLADIKAVRGRSSKYLQALSISAAQHPAEAVSRVSAESCRVHLLAV